MLVRLARAVSTLKTVSAPIRNASSQVPHPASGHDAATQYCTFFNNGKIIARFGAYKIPYAEDRKPKIIVSNHPSESSLPKSKVESFATPCMIDDDAHHGCPYGSSALRR